MNTVQNAKGKPPAALSKFMRTQSAIFIVALGPTVPELDIDSLGPLYLGTIDKTLFSMLTPEVRTILAGRNSKSVVLFGIEVRSLNMCRYSESNSLQSHVCVLQSTLDLLSEGYDVHVLADGVSSCNKEEVPIALDRMRQAGAQITTSESAAFQLQRTPTVSVEIAIRC